MTDRVDDQGRTRGERVAVDDMTAAPVDTVSYARPARDVGVDSVTQMVTVPADRVRWGPVWAGLLTALFTLLVLSLLGVAIGLTTINASAAASGSIAGDTGRNSAIWAAIAAILSFGLGGYVAGRTAAVHTRGWAALNGALVFLLALPLVLWLASQGLGTVIGNANNIANGLGINLGQLGHTATNLTPTQAQQATDTARNTAWGTLIGLLLGLAAGAIGGTLGLHRAPRMTTPRTGYTAS